MASRECIVANTAIATGITEQTDAQDVIRGILQILNESGDLHDCIQHILALLKTWTGADAVGLRLEDGDDFPYFAQDGFPSDFLKAENSLLARSKNGGLCRDRDGNVSLECTCGLVIAGKTDPASPLCTPGGSFWTNDALPLLDQPANQDRRVHPRNNCIHQGYASVALIPLRTKDRIVGLIQFNDKRKDRFTLRTIEVMEDIAMHIGAALVRKRLEAELMQSHKALRALLRRIEHAQEAERARIARDMHDDLGQSLTAINMDLRWIEIATEGSAAAPDIGAIHARVTATIEIVAAMTATVQELAASLRPSVLDHLGLVAAIRSESQRFQARSGIVCRTSLPDTLPDIPAAAAMPLFRILQECLTNVARHSGASRAGIRVGIIGGNIVLRVHDNGKGIAPEFIEGPATLGLLGMKERAIALGGEVRFQRGKRHGTLVTVRVPVQ